MNDADIAATAERILAAALPIDAAPYRLELRSVRCANGFLDGSFGFTVPEGPALEGDVSLLANAGSRGEDGLTAWLGAWCAAVRTVLASAAACDPVLRPVIHLYRLTVHDPFATPLLAKKATRDAYEKALLGPEGFGEHLRADPATLRAFLERFAAAATEVFPIRHEEVELRLAESGKDPSPVSGEPYGSMDGPAIEANRQGIGMLLELAIYEGKPRQLRDLKQQRVTFASHHSVVAHPDRVIAFLRGWAATLPRLFAKTEMETMMPHDLVDAEVLEMVRPVTAHDFARALERRWRL